MVVKVNESFEKTRQVKKYILREEKQKNNIIFTIRKSRCIWKYHHRIVHLNTFTTKYNTPLLLRFFFDIPFLRVIFRVCGAFHWYGFSQRSQKCHHWIELSKIIQWYIICHIY